MFSFRISKLTHKKWRAIGIELTSEAITKQTGILLTQFWMIKVIRYCQTYVYSTLTLTLFWDFSDVLKCKALNTSTLISQYYNPWLIRVGQNQIAAFDTCIQPPNSKRSKQKQFTDNFASLIFDYRKKNTNTERTTNTVKIAEIEIELARKPATKQIGILLMNVGLTMIRNYNVCLILHFAWR